MRIFTVPGSVLLAGEYAITCNGGLGLALAPNRFLRLQVTPDRRFSLIGRAHGAVVDGSGLGEAVQLAAAQILSFSPTDSRFCGKVIADSSELFSEKGHKLGLGSSAALAVGLAAFFVDCINPLDVHCSLEQLNLIRKIALRGHRLFQGGGSGYDVCTSCYGGVGLFTGGESPSWTSLRVDHDMEIALISARNSVCSGSAVQSFKKLQLDREKDIARFIAHSNQVVLRLAEAINAGGACSHSLYLSTMAARRAGLWIGRNLGLDPEGGDLGGDLAELRKHRIPCKASGAGDELAVAFGFSPGYFSQASNVLCARVTREGVQWR